MSLFADLIDKGAKQRPEEATLRDVLFVIVPGVLGTASVVSNFWSFVFASDLYLSFWIKSVLSLLLLFVAIVVIVSKHRILLTRVILHPEGSAGEGESYSGKQYSFTKRIRQTAKLFFLPLVLISILAIWNALPCGVVHEGYISGRIAANESTDKIDGVIRIQGIAGDTISERPERLDDVNFFYCRLKRWASKPEFIVLETPDRQLRIRIEDGVTYQTAPYRASVWSINK
jgi:hypothetical protein